MKPVTDLALLPRRLLALPLRVYRFFLSPWLGTACRFEPTCSNYALQALEQRGAATGTYLALRRVLRCHPWCAGGLDLVPPAEPAQDPLTKSHS
jgi:putative membrane protein insertion efficiency factor